MHGDARSCCRMDGRRDTAQPTRPDGRHIEWWSGGSCQCLVANSPCDATMVAGRFSGDDQDRLLQQARDSATSGDYWSGYGPSSSLPASCALCDYEPHFDDLPDNLRTAFGHNGGSFDDETRATLHDLVCSKCDSDPVIVSANMSSRKPSR